jgi:hypothetical protein
VTKPADSESTPSVTTQQVYSALTEPICTPPVGARMWCETTNQRAHETHEPTKSNGKTRENEGERDREIIEREKGRRTEWEIEIEIEKVGLSSMDSNDHVSPRSSASFAVKDVAQRLVTTTPTPARLSSAAVATPLHSTPRSAAVRSPLRLASRRQLRVPRTHMHTQRAHTRQVKGRTHTSCRHHQPPKKTCDKKAVCISLCTSVCVCLRLSVTVCLSGVCVCVCLWVLSVLTYSPAPHDTSLPPAHLAEVAARSSITAARHLLASTPARWCAGSSDSAGPGP